MREAVYSDGLFALSVLCLGPPTEALLSSSRVRTDHISCAAHSQTCFISYSRSRPNLAVLGRLRHGARTRLVHSFC